MTALGLWSIQTKLRGNNIPFSIICRSANSALHMDCLRKLSWIRLRQVPDVFQPPSWSSSLSSFLSLSCHPNHHPHHQSTIIMIFDIVAITNIRRVHVAILVFVGLITNYMLRVNINMTIEYMTKWAGQILSKLNLNLKSAFWNPRKQMLNRLAANQQYLHLFFQPREGRRSKGWLDFRSERKHQIGTLHWLCYNAGSHWHLTALTFISECIDPITEVVKAVMGNSIRIITFLSI